MDKDLETAYRQALYFAAPEGGDIPLRIGVPSAEMRDWMQRAGVQGAALITAWNPMSVARVDEENTRANALLEEQLRASCKVVAPARGQSPDGTWREPGFLAADLRLETAGELGREWQQHAIVWIPSSGVPDLIPCLLA